MNKYLPLLIFFILADVIGDNSIVQIFGTQPPFSALMLSMGFLVMQILAAPIQAGFSDFYCRRKSLIVALSFSFLSFVFLFFTKTEGSSSILLFVLILLIKGALGNTVPLSWSALADTQEKNLRFSLALSTGAYAIGYMVLAVLNMHGISGGRSNQFWLSSDIISAILFVLSVAFCVLFFRDVRDRKEHLEYKNRKLEYLKLAHSESTALLKDMRHFSTQMGLLAYFLWATSQYSVLILLADFQTKYTTIVILMMCGYLVGVAILGFCRKVKDGIIIRSAFVITISSFVLFFVLNPFMNDIQIPLSISYFFFTLGNAFLSPSILSLFSKERALHQQGKGFGLIVSADSGGFLAGSIAVIAYNYLKLNPEQMVIFSFVLFLISWFPYSKYERTRKDVFRITNTTVEFE
jgi:MFS family permease